MTLEEAIRIKRIWIDSGYAPPGPNEVSADNLSIEALEREKKFRPTSGPRNFDLLPGETED